MTSAKPCIAVVDDEEPVRTMLRRVLTLAGYEVAAFASGEEFLRSLAARTPAGAILDVHMPGVSGFEVRTRLDAMRRDLPAIFITASDDPALDDLARGDHRGALLRKPFSSDDLLAAVAAMLDRG